jgi:hypothetical protein
VSDSRECARVIRVVEGTLDCLVRPRQWRERALRRRTGAWGDLSRADGRHCDRSGGKGDCW